jgi:hypothetical protein
MQDHICRIDENLLHRTAGPYIWVIRVGLAAYRRFPLDPYKQTSLPCVGMSQNGMDRPCSCPEPLRE